MRNAFLHIAAVVAALVLLAERTDATMVARLPLGQVARKADRIVHATVSDVRVGRDGNGLPATWATLDIRRSLKGRASGTIVIKQYGTATPLADGTVTRVAGLPRYVAGDEIVLFLRPESPLGFTSPVGFGQGTYRVHGQGGRRRVRGDQAPEPGRDLEQFLSEVEQLAGSAP